MEEIVSQDGRKRRLTSGPENILSDKRRRTCHHGEECELTTIVLAQQSAIRNLAAIVEELRVAVLEGQPVNTISTDRSHSENPKSCPAHNCTKAFDRTDHLHRHIRGIHDEQHRRLTKILDQKYCVQCGKRFKRPCDLVRHEKSYHDEIYISRVYKFASRPLGFGRAPTPPDTSSNASADLDDLASEFEQDDVQPSDTRHTYLGTGQNGSIAFSDFPQTLGLANDQPYECPAYFDVSSSDLQNNDTNHARFLPPFIPFQCTFDMTPSDHQRYLHLDNNGSIRTGIAYSDLPFFDTVLEDSSLGFTQELS